MAVGTSAGGRFKKAIIAIDGNGEDMVRHGATANGIAPFLARLMRDRLRELSPEVFGPEEDTAAQLLRFVRNH